VNYVLGEENETTIQPPLLCFSHLQLVSRAFVLLSAPNSVTYQDLRKTCLLVNLLFLVLVEIIVLLAINYGTSEDKKSDSKKALRFNGNPEEFSRLKTKM